MTHPINETEASNGNQLLASYKVMIEARLHDLFASQSDSPQTAQLFQSERYSLFGNGKRIRPLLVLTVCKMLGSSPTIALDYAAAVEMIHTYSLIHDDLPCMDNDDYRRGKPTNHRMFGEATAVLAGDGLLTDAFGIAATSTLCSDAQNLRAVSILSQAAGSHGMIAGQTADLFADTNKLSEKAVLEMYQNKTVGLIRASVSLGAIAANLSDDHPHMEALLSFADALGLAFQIIDDLLDIGEKKENLYLSFHTIEEARQHAKILTEKALSELAHIKVPKESSQPLITLTHWLLHRNY